MVRRLVSAGTVPGVHFCTLNLEKSVRTILENLEWTATSTNNRFQASPRPRHNQLIEDDLMNSQPPQTGTISGQGIDIPAERGSELKQLNDLSISPSQASQLAEWGLRHDVLPPVPKKGGAGQGNQGQGEDSWDEYPNGRFTDVRSPAYGEIDGWGSGLKITVSPRRVGSLESAIDMSRPPRH